MMFVIIVGKNSCGNSLRISSPLSTGLNVRNSWTSLVLDITIMFKIYQCGLLHSLYAGGCDINSEGCRTKSWLWSKLSVTCRLSSNFSPSRNDFSKRLLSRPSRHTSSAFNYHFSLTNRNWATPTSRQRQILASQLASMATVLCWNDKIAKNTKSK